MTGSQAFLISRQMVGSSCGHGVSRKISQAPKQLLWNLERGQNENVSRNISICGAENKEPAGEIGIDDGPR